MDNLVFDDSGDLVHEAFYELEIPVHEWGHPLHRRKGTVQSIVRSGDEDAAGEFVTRFAAVTQYLVDEKMEEHSQCKVCDVWKCPEDRRTLEQREKLDFSVDWHHALSEYEWMVVDFHQKGAWSPIIPLHTEDDEKVLVIRGDVAEEFTRAKLRRFGLGRVDLYRPNQKDKTELKVVQFKGGQCERHITLIGAPNACPFCGKTPLICPTCGSIFSPCKKCESECIVSRAKHKGPDDRRLVIAPYEEIPRDIMEGRKWDGADFIRKVGLNVISRRVLHLLQRLHAFPYYAFPMKMDVRGMSPEQLRWLREAYDGEFKVVTKKRSW